MADDDASCRMHGRHLPQPLADIFVGQSVKSVAPDALRIEFARQGIGVADPRMGAVKGGIEAGDLQRVGKGAMGRAHAGKIMRLV